MIDRGNKSENDEKHINGIRSKHISIMSNNVTTEQWS